MVNASAFRFDSTVAFLREALSRRAERRCEDDSLRLYVEFRSRDVLFALRGRIDDTESRLFRRYVPKTSTACSQLDPAVYSVHMVALRAVTAIGIVGLYLAFVAPAMFANPPLAFSGISLQDHRDPPIGSTTVRVEPNSPAARAGLRTGDRISCLTPRIMQLLVLQPGGSARYAPGAIPLCVKRDGRWQAVTVTLVRRAPEGNQYGSLFVSALRLGVFVAFAAIGIFLVIARPGPLTWIFFAFALSSGPVHVSNLNNTNYPEVTYDIIVTLLRSLASAGSGFMLIFALHVPDDRVRTGWRLIAARTAWLVVFAMAGVQIAQAFRGDLTFSRQLEAALDWVVTAGIAIVLIARLALTRGEVRARVAWAAGAILLGLLINDVRHRLPIEYGALTGTLTIATPIALVYAIMKRQIIDIRFIISRALVYATLTTIIVAIVGLLDYATSTLLARARMAMAIEAIVTVALGFALNAGHRRIENAVDSLIFRKKHEAQIYLNRLGKTLLRALHEETVDRALVHDPYEKLALTMAALFRAEGTSFALSCAAGWSHPTAQIFDGDHDLVRFLLTERTPLHVRELRSAIAAQLRENDIAPTVVIPIFQGDELTAFALFGLHRDGTRLDPDEIVTLERLCEAGAQAYTRVENLRYRALARKPTTV